jgi:hypothetical protein
MFVAGVVIWSGFTLGWWGWLAVTNRVPAGEPGTTWWPSIKDLVSPGRTSFAVPPQLQSSTYAAKVLSAQQQATAKTVTGLEAQIPSGNETFQGGA